MKLRHYPDLSQHFTDHMAVYIGEAAVGAVVEYAQFLVVDAHQVQNRGVDVVAVGLAFSRTPGPGIAFAVRHAGFHTGPGKPRHRCARVVVAASGTLLWQ